MWRATFAAHGVSTDCSTAKITTASTKPHQCDQSMRTPSRTRSATISPTAAETRKMIARIVKLIMR